MAKRGESVASATTQMQVELAKLGGDLAIAREERDEALRLADRLRAALQRTEAESHSLANALTAAQVRLGLLLQGPSAVPREPTCEYPGCNGPVPPGETICGRVHPPVGRRA